MARKLTKGKISAVVFSVGEGPVYSIARSSADWKGLLLDVLAVIKREYKATDTEIVTLIDESGPDSLEARAVLNEVNLRTEGLLVKPRRQDGKGTRLSGGETKKAKAKVSKVRRDSGKNKKA